MLVDIALHSVRQYFIKKHDMRTLEELINKEEPGWDLVQEWMQEATNPYEVLPRDAKRAETELLNAQVTTRSPMGAIIYETGGILIDGGWIRRFRFRL